MPDLKIPLLLAALALVWGGQSGAESALSDSLASPYEEMLVSAEAAPPPGPGRTRVETPEIAMRDPGTLADLGAVLPSVRVSTNSRGESTLMIRGAPERHVQVFLDGIPLNLPWDERVDLESIPITGVGRLEGRRGLPSLLDGPGVLAGSVRILPPQIEGRDRSARLGLSIGSQAMVRASLSGQRRSGPWNLLAAGGWHSRDAFPLPGTGDPRFNSDRQQMSLLLRGSRPVAGRGRLNLLASAWGSEKGVPPETHLGQDARFWRYPLRGRALAGGSLALPLGDGAWDLNTMLAVDFFRQEIDPRGPDGWDQPLENGQDYEKDFDRTGHLAAGLTRWLGPDTRLSLQTNLRYTQHRESLTVGGGVNSYSQNLAAVVLEAEHGTDAGWNLRGGVGLDQAATPESGDKPGADAFTAEALNLRLARRLDGKNEVYLAASRRSRFPSLRELYSGALGRFVPNPGLAPERQDLLETGFTLLGSGWQVSGAAFLQYLKDGIEKEALPATDGQFMRVNRTTIRVPGLELNGSWRWRPQLDVFAQHTVLAARVETATGFDRPAEDRPDYLSRLGISWHTFSGPGALLEAVVTGARWSADSTSDTGLTRLPAAVSWNARLSWRWEVGTRADGLAAEVEAFLRADNLFDQAAHYQVGLPEPGRVVSCGASVSY
jgi:iron complex outermembrane receptor protein